MKTIKVSALKEYIQKIVKSRLEESNDFPASKESVWNKLTLLQRYLREASPEELEILENGLDDILKKLDYLEMFAFDLDPV
jgi:hypothetical protein